LGDEVAVELVELVVHVVERRRHCGVAVGIRVEGEAIQADASSFSCWISPRVRGSIVVRRCAGPLDDVDHQVARALDLRESRMAVTTARRSLAIGCCVARR